MRLPMTAASPALRAVGMGARSPHAFVRGSYSWVAAIAPPPESPPSTYSRSPSTATMGWFAARGMGAAKLQRAAAGS